MREPYVADIVRFLYGSWLGFIAEQAMSGDLG